MRVAARQRLVFANTLTFAVCAAVRLLMAGQGPTPRGRAATLRADGIRDAYVVAQTF